MPASRAINKPLAFDTTEVPERSRVVNIAHKNRTEPKGRLVHIVPEEDFCELRHCLKIISGAVKGMQETVDLMLANRRFEP